MCCLAPPLFHSLTHPAANASWCSPAPASSGFQTSLLYTAQWYGLTLEAFMKQHMDVLTRSERWFLSVAAFLILRFSVFSELELMFLLQLHFSPTTLFMRGDGRRTRQEEKPNTGSVWLRPWDLGPEGTDSHFLLWLSLFRYIPNAFVRSIIHNLCESPPSSLTSYLLN